MALSGLLARFKPNRPDPDSIARVKGWVREALALPEEASVTVNEIACTDPTCPGLETVILVMRPGQRTVAYKARGSVMVQTRPIIEKAVTTPS